MDMNSTAVKKPEVGLLLEDKLYIGLLSILMVLILTLNCFVILVISKHRHLRTGNYLFILSLTLADACIALFVIPGHISSRFSEEYLGNILCSGCSYASYTSVAAAVFSLSTISLTRLRAVAFPLKPKINGRQIGIAIALIWGTALVYGLRGALTFSLTEIVIEKKGILANRVICGVNTTRFVRNSVLAGLDFFIIFLIPALIISISYLALLYSLAKHVHSMETNLQEMQAGNNNNSNNHYSKNAKAVRMSIIIISIFVVCHLPEHVMKVYLSRDAHLIPGTVSLMLIFNVMTFLNSALNPIFYGFMNPKIRDAFLTLIGRLCRNKGRHSFQHS